MTTQTIDTYKGYEVRVMIYLKSDKSGDAPASWTVSSGNGVNLVGVATSASCSATCDVTDITGLNQQTPYNTKQGNITYEWALDQLYTTTQWADDTGTPVSTNVMNMISSGYKFAMQIAAMNAAGESATASEITIVMTQCSIGDDELSVDGSDGDLTISMSGKAAARTAANT